MGTCIKTIVECLKESGITPVVTSKSELSAGYSPSLAIDYTSSSSYFWFSGYDGSSQWWKIDFTKKVSLGSYSMRVDAFQCKWIYKWKASVSTDDVNWKVVDTPAAGFPNNEMHFFNRTYNVRYFKLETIDAFCNYYMAFRKIYFYGSLNCADSLMRSCFCKKGTRVNILLFIALAFS